MVSPNETYLAAFLHGLRAVGADPCAFLRRHEPLFARYADVDAVCAVLRGDDAAAAALVARAAGLAGAELDAAPGSAGLYSLRSVFSRLQAGGQAAEPVFYRPAPLTLDGIFPGKTQEPLPGDLLAGLEAALDALREPPADAPDFFVLLDTLFKKHLWAVPAAAGRDIDVSLYDAQRSTAAITACLLRTGPEAAQPYLLLAADFSGIQRYIFAVAHTNAAGVASRLRARSFLVDALVQGLAYHLCAQLDIPQGNILMLTGGKCYLLLPNIPAVADALPGIRAQLARSLFRRYRAEVAVNMVWLPLADDGLRDYSASITRLTALLRAARRRPFAGELTGEAGWNTDAFVLRHDLAGKQACPSCRHRLMDAGQQLCPDCARQQQLGDRLPGARLLYFSTGGGEYPLWDDVYLSLTGSEAKGRLLRVDCLNDWDLPAGLTHLPLGVRLMVNHLPVDDQGRPLSFQSIAGRAKGRKQLVVLKADVDNLGYLFADGLRTETRHYGTVSRVATMSRMLELFFSGYITHLLGKAGYRDVYSVFSGGDDLFLLGPWDVMLRLALEVQQAFTRFAGANPCVTLSAALHLADPYTHVALLAEASEAELKRVKNSAPQALYPGRPGRDGVSFLGDICTWPDMADQLDNIDRLLPVVRSVNVGTLRRIAEYSEMYRRFLLDHDVLGLMFEPLLHYDRSRNYNVYRLRAEVPAFLEYVDDLPKNAADYRQPKKDLYFAKTVMTCILNLSKGAK